MPEDTDVLVGDLVDEPKVTHLHGAGALAFHGVIGYANGGRVIAVDRRWWLYMAHLVENESDDLGFLYIEE